MLRDSLHGIKHDIVLTDAYGKPKLILNQKYKEFLDSENRQRVPAGLKLRGAIREIVASGDQVLIK